MADFPEVAEGFRPWGRIDDTDPAVARMWIWNREQHTLLPHVYEEKDVVISNLASVDPPMKTPGIAIAVGESVFVLEPVCNVATFVHNQIREPCLTQTGMSLPQLQQKPCEQEQPVFARGIQIPTIVVVIGARTAGRN